MGAASHKSILPPSWLAYSGKSSSFGWRNLRITKPLALMRSILPLIVLRSFLKYRSVVAGLMSNLLALPSTVASYVTKPYSSSPANSQDWCFVSTGLGGMSSMDVLPTL